MNYTSQKKISDGKHLHFRFSKCLNHEAIILRQKENTTALSWRRELPKCIISTNGHHVICSINLEELPQVSEFERSWKIIIHKTNISQIYQSYGQANLGP